MDQPANSNPFEHMDPRDGLRLVRTTLGHSVSLFAAVYSGGEQVHLPTSVVNAEPDEPLTPDCVYLHRADVHTNAQSGEVERLEMVLDAVIRYLNTGGQWEPLLRKLSLLAKAVPVGLSFPGHHLLTSYVTTEGRYQHIFVKTGTHDAVLWEEPDVSDSGYPIGGFLDLTTLERIKEQDELEANVDVQQAIEQAEEEAEAAEG